MSRTDSENSQSMHLSETLIGAYGREIGRATSDPGGAELRQRRMFSFELTPRGHG